MGNYIITFDDGSEYLAHYGVMGMKWGVWNAETAARRAGYKAAKYREKASKTKNPDQIAKYKTKAQKYDRAYTKHMSNLSTKVVSDGRATVQKALTIEDKLKAEERAFRQESRDADRYLKQSNKYYGKSKKTKSSAKQEAYRRLASDYGDKWWAADKSADAHSIKAARYEREMARRDGRPLKNLEWS